MTALTQRLPIRPSLSGNASGAMLMVGGMIALQTGSALATHLFGAVGPSGTAWLRMSFAAVFLVLFTRRGMFRELRGAGLADLAAAALLGAVSASMTLFYSEAVARIPLGTATSIEFTGPLLIAVLSMRRRQELLWIVLAGAGLLALTRPWSGAMDGAGLLFAAGAAASWALFVLTTQTVGERFSGVNGLAIAMVSATVVSAPFGLPGVLSNPDPLVIAASAGIAILMPLLPYAFDLEALRRLTRTAYGTVAGLEPAVASLIGLVVLAQLPGLMQAVGIVMVVTAGIGAARAGRRPESTTVARGGPSADVEAEAGLDVARPEGSERTVGASAATGTETAPASADEGTPAGPGAPSVDAEHRPARPVERA